MKHSRGGVWNIGIVVLALLSGSGCGFNVFGWMDSPTNDAQILSRARACFDQGDLTCARAYYARLSTSYADIQASELAFAILHENGATMNAFLTSFGGGTSGSGFSRLAESMKDGAGETKRLAVYQAYAQVAAISDQHLRGLVRFVSATALAAEMLAEDIAVDGNTSTHSGNDLVQDSATCATFSAGTCAAQASCGAPAGAVMQTGAVAVDLDTGVAVVTGTNPTLYMFNAAIQELLFGLGGSELDASSSLSSTVNSVSTALDAAATLALPANPECYLNALILQGIGQ